MCDGTTQLFPDPSEPDSNPLLHYTSYLHVYRGLLHGSLTWDWGFLC